MLPDKPCFGVQIGAQHRPARLFVVDDEKIIAWTMSKLLTRVGYEVATFNNPVLAIEAFREHPADMVISDIVMPEMSGIDLAILITQHTPDCKVLLLSGQANMPQLLGRVREDGFEFEVLAKPIAPEMLLRLIGESLGLANPGSQA